MKKTAKPKKKVAYKKVNIEVEKKGTSEDIINSILMLELLYKDREIDTLRKADFKNVDPEEIFAYLVFRSVQDTLKTVNKNKLLNLTKEKITKLSVTSGFLSSTMYNKI